MTRKCVLKITGKKRDFRITVERAEDSTFDVVFAMAIDDGHEEWVALKACPDFATGIRNLGDTKTPPDDIENILSCLISKAQSSCKGTTDA